MIDVDNYEKLSVVDEDVFSCTAMGSKLSRNAVMNICGNKKSCEECVKE